MTLAVSILLISAVLALVLFIRPGAIPPTETLSPTAHLEERKAAINENLRDLNFEYRLGKLSEADYAKSRQVLENQLARVNATIVSLVGKTARPVPPVPKPVDVQVEQKKASFRCPACGAEFDKAMKFCGECAAPMEVAKS